MISKGRSIINFNTNKKNMLMKIFKNDISTSNN